MTQRNTILGQCMISEHFSSMMSAFLVVVPGELLCCFPNSRAVEHGI